MWTQWPVVLWKEDPLSAYRASDTPENTMEINTRSKATFVNITKSDFNPPPFQLSHTCSITSTTHSVIGPPSAHHVVAATPRRSVVRARSLHAHGLPLGLVMGPHLSTATLEDLNVPESIEILE